MLSQILNLLTSHAHQILLTLQQSWTEHLLFLFNGFLQVVAVNNDLLHGGPSISKTPAAILNRLLNVLLSAVFLFTRVLERQTVLPQTSWLCSSRDFCQPLLNQLIQYMQISVSILLQYVVNNKVYHHKTQQKMYWRSHNPEQRLIKMLPKWVQKQFISRQIVGTCGCVCLAKAEKRQFQLSGFKPPNLSF